MKRPAIGFAAALAACMSVWSGTAGYAQTSAKPPSVGIIESVTKGCVLAREGGARQLDPKKDPALMLYGGDRLSCKGAGRLKVRIGPDLQTIDKGMGEVVLKWAPATASDERARRALDNYAIRGGRARSPMPELCAPEDGSKVSTRTLAIRWKPDPAASAFKLELRPGTSRARVPEVVWTSDGSVDPRAGSLPVESLREFLVARQKASELGPYDLYKVVGTTSSRVARFSLLPLQDETEVAALLGEIPAGGDTSLFTHLQRASIYDEFDLRSEASEELRQALKMAPESVELKARFVEVEAECG